jgi:hypothetical protein
MARSKIDTVTEERNFFVEGNNDIQMMLKEKQLKKPGLLSQFVE